MFVTNKLAIVPCDSKLLVTVVGRQSTQTVEKLDGLSVRGILSRLNIKLKIGVVTVQVITAKELRRANQGKEYVVRHLRSNLINLFCRS